MSRRLLRAAAVLAVTLALLAACEGVLRLVGYGAPPASSSDPTLQATLPLFRPAAGRDGVPMLQRSDAPVAFRQEKPANGYRVFVVGESSAFGYPFGPEFAFSRFLQERLAAAMPDRSVEVVNAAIPGIGSWQARQVVEEVAAYRPDVLVVYLGHNEFNRSGPAEVGWLTRWAGGLRFYQLASAAGDAVRGWRHAPGSVGRMRRDNDPFGPIRDRARGATTLTTRDREWSLSRFRENLYAIVATARAAGATVVLAGLAQNVTDHRPGASRHRRGLSPDERAQWRAAMEHAAERMRAQDCRGALAALRRSLEIDTRPAIAHYMRAQCLEQLGRFATARAAYRTASERDEVPLGAPSAANRLIAEVAAETGSQFVDVPAALERISPHGLVGADLFCDSIHPSVAGHLAIARILGAALGVPADGGPQTDVAALLAAHPDIEDKIYRTNAVFYLMLGWHDAAQAELDEAVERYPELREFRDGIAKFKAQDKVGDWTDLPDAGD
jgi:lysophospholipase L1-like esterase